MAITIQLLKGTRIKQDHNIQLKYLTSVYHSSHIFTAYLTLRRHNLTHTTVYIDKKYADLRLLPHQKSVTIISTSITSPLQIWKFYSMGNSQLLDKCFNFFRRRCNLTEIIMVKAGAVYYLENQSTESNSSRHTAYLYIILCSHYYHNINYNNNNHFNYHNHNHNQNHKVKTEISAHS